MEGCGVLTHAATTTANVYNENSPIVRFPIQLPACAPSQPASEVPAEPGPTVCQNPGPNVLHNGSFEQPGIVNPKTNNLWAVYGGASVPQFYDPQPSIPGWNPNHYQVELQRNGLFGTAAHGNQYAEVDAPGDVLLTQTVHAAEGEAFELSFAYTARPDAGNQSMQIVWNGQRVDSVSQQPAANLRWRYHTFRLTARQGQNTLGFGSIAGPRGAGNFLDNVRLRSCGVEQQNANADLSVAKSGPSSVTRGGTIAYTVTAHNAGPGTATNVTISDVIPAGFQFNQSQSQGCVLNANGSSVLCNNFNLSAGHSKTFTIAFHVPAVDNCSQSTVHNVATISTSATDPNSSNNTSQAVVTQVLCQGGSNTSLTIHKSGPSSIERGEVITYHITVVNTGNNAAANVLVTDAVPAGLNFLPAGSNESCGLLGNNVVQCNLGTIAAGGNRTFVLNFIAPTIANCNSTSVVQNIATVTSAQSGASSSPAVTTTVLCQDGNNNNFTVTKSDGRTTAQPNDTVSYTITITNNSSNSVSNATVTDVLPSSLSFISASDGGHLNGQTVTWQNIFVPGNSSRTLTLQARVNSNVSNGTVIVNSATVNNQTTGTDTTVIQTGTNQTNIRLEVTDSPDPVDAGDTLRYDIRVINQQSFQSTVTVTQILSSDTDFRSASDNGSHNNGVITWNITLNANESRTLTSTVRIDSDLNDNDEVRTTVFAANASEEERTRVREDDDDNDNDDDEEVQVRITDSPDPVEAGDTLEYTIELENDSNSSQTVDVRAFLDSRTRFLSASDNGDDTDDDLVLWRNIRVSRDSTERLTLRVRVDNDVADRETLRLRVRTDDDEDTEDTRVRGELYADNDDDNDDNDGVVTIQKQADRSEAQPGDVIIYSLTIRNVSDAIVRNVRVEDTFDGGKASVIDAGDAQVGGGSIRWAFPQLAAGETRVLTYRLQLSSHLTHGDVIVNTARVTADNLPAVPTGVSTVHIVQRLPQTGLSDFFGPFQDGSSLLRPFAGKTAAMPAIVWGSLLLLGLSLGVRAGRRYLI